MAASTIKEYVTASGVVLEGAFVILKGVSVFSHTVTTEGVSEEQRDIEFTFNVYASDAAYQEGKSPIESFSEMAKFDNEKSIDEQALVFINK
ncbi:TPA: hypothetical protein L9R01_005208 [Klebsiella pneumoniae]|uniref:hypothetical protein n=1 Tax=Klebsiella TaxID=570 RepID=UPI0006671AA5|nr:MULTISPECIES: hypothetical protein [Klebsiella]HDS5085231.1 hypothetical protein [Klebsiella pneumoniae subsp. pneumoniae]AUU95630.1 hypothetical protein C2U49_12880 [Klebsiella pneumoniae]MCI8216856.1 hypothetical protein [Klebsiella pneumoniae]MDG9943086.1 hypothetical protein [Klebsiella pneumoniae]MDK5806508.1 hypothetical protein [Klebsiella pneumoniae]